jgi:sulfur-carrier protein
MKLLYFAWVRQRIGRAEETLDVPSSVKTVSALMAHLAARGPGYAAAFRDPAQLRCAVNQEHAPFETAIGPDEEIAFFPPVTGG